MSGACLHIQWHSGGPVQNPGNNCFHGRKKPHIPVVFCKMVICVRALGHSSCVDVWLPACRSGWGQSFNSGLAENTVLIYLLA